MQISLHHLGKRYNRHWIFRRLDYSFTAGTAYAITGPNGSGKSTLLQVLAGATEKSEGTISFHQAGSELPAEMQYQYISLVAPYLELIEELTLAEFLDFHFRFKPILPDFNTSAIIDYVGLKEATLKQIRNFSSGMKQRVKLAQAFFSNSPVLLLDEPTANLDLQGINLYHTMVKELQNQRLLVICSNDEQEISFCQNRIYMPDWKNQP